MVRKQDNVFVLDTAHTTYVFRITETGHLEHLYYGRKITIPLQAEGAARPLTEQHAFCPGNAIVYDEAHGNYTPEDMRWEVSFHGKGDIREPFLEVVHADGSRTSDFVFESGEVAKKKHRISGMPGAYDETGKAEQLCVRLRDAAYGLVLELYYTVYEACDVITRSARLINESSETVQVLRLMSTQLDFDKGRYSITNFTGAWAREMKRTTLPLTAGKFVNASFTGTSSNRANPFVVISSGETTEDFGECYGINLVYSGNHYEAAEIGSHGKLRVVAGINPQSFCWQLPDGEVFEAPEAVMSYSAQGYNGLSGQLHAFVREHIVRGEWKKKTRPVLLNSWEASYFDISERSLLKLAKAGKDVGIELFVMDDGWFGERKDDTTSLGDWTVNEKKLPGGVQRIAEKIRELGLLFGIWVEPEMVNVKSRLYEAHPDWTLSIPGRPHSEGRNQRVLDLTRREVQDYIIEEMSKVFSSADISYVKWDMNRNFSDVFSAALPPEQQGEVTHRYVLGLYRCMEELTKRFPHILFEGCASGGNRFDLGILSYFPQIWASDNTDAVCRAEMQTGYSYGYPMSVVGAHVSACPNHQTLRVTPLQTRFAVAAFGVFGYECNLCDMKKEDLEAIEVQIAWYKEWRQVLQYGRFYRGRSFTATAGNGSVLAPDAGTVCEWTCVAPDGERAVGMLLQKLAAPNTHTERYFAKGLCAEKLYHFSNCLHKYDIREFGDLVNTVSPVHIKQDSLTHQLIAKFVKLDGEVEDCYACGDTLMYAGVHLKQAFAGTGYNGEVRHYPDFAARLYMMTAVEGE